MRTRTPHTSMSACEQGHCVPSERKRQHDKQEEERRGRRRGRVRKEWGGEAGAKGNTGKAFDENVHAGQHQMPRQ